MADKDPSPEEQLLKLVEKPASEEGGQQEDAQDEAGKRKKGFLGLGGLFFKGSKGKESKSEGKNPGQYAVFNIRVWNHTLLALVLAAGAYLVLDLTILKFDESKFLAQVGTNEAVYPIFDEEEIAKGRDLSYYTDPLEKRNPFISPSAPPEETGEDAAVEALSQQTDEMADLLNSMKLVGISWADEPIAMIEDVSTGRTYFARRGQIVRGVKVESITKEKVTVTYEGEEGFLI